MKASIEYINPFIEASKKILKDFCNIETSIGKPYLKDSLYTNDHLTVTIGLTGHISGQVVINMNVDVACDLASKIMMGIKVDELNDMVKSAIGELVNMIVGNTATIFSNKGLNVNITPPCVQINNDLNFIDKINQSICIPFSLKDDDEIEFNIFFNN